MNNRVNPEHQVMASMADRETLDSWEKMMACCFPCGFVWFKEGTGSSCCINVLLGCLLGACCVNVCHACSYVGAQAKQGSPCEVISSHGEVERGQVISKQPL